jgi:hypothetical protein
MTDETKLIVKCQRRGKDNTFEQPYAYHAGFSDQGFLYSDSGHCTLVWSWYDPSIERMFGSKPMWTQEPGERERFENALRFAPDGGRWRFHNRPRCLHCSAPIAGSMLEHIYYLVYPGSIITDQGASLNLNLQLK